MSRYDPPDPKCRHKRKGIVKAGDWGGRHASHAVCDRPACIEDAKAWAWALTHLPPEFIPDARCSPGESITTRVVEQPAQIDGSGGADG